jgi:hypothetical protein
MLSNGPIHVVTSMQHRYQHNTKQESGIELPAAYDIKEMPNVPPSRPDNGGFEPKEQ